MSSSWFLYRFCMMYLPVMLVSFGLSQRVVTWRFFFEWGNSIQGTWVYEIYWSNYLCIMMNKNYAFDPGALYIICFLKNTKKASSPSTGNSRNSKTKLGGTTSTLPSNPKTWVNKQKESNPGKSQHILRRKKWSRLDLSVNTHSNTLQICQHCRGRSWVPLLWWYAEKKRIISNKHRKKRRTTKIKKAKVIQLRTSCKTKESLSTWRRFQLRKCW